MNVPFQSEFTSTSIQPLTNNTNNRQTILPIKKKHWCLYSNVLKKIIYPQKGSILFFMHKINNNLKA